MARYETAIVGGMVVDGTRMPRRRCDVGIVDGRIAKLGRVDPGEAERVLDATSPSISASNIFSFSKTRPWTSRRRIRRNGPLNKAN